MDLTDVQTLVPTNPSDNLERAERTQLTLNDLATDCPQTTDATYTGPQKHWEYSEEYASYTMDRHNRCNPRLAIPKAIKRYGYPYWKHCQIFGNKFGWFDPPGAVPTVAGILPTSATAATTSGSEAAETSVEAFPSAAESMPSVTKDPTTSIHTDEKSTRAKPTVSAWNVQERPNADTGIAATEDSTVAPSSNPPKDQGKQASDSIAYSKAAVAVASIFKAGAVGHVVTTSPTIRPPGNVNPTASANAGANKEDSEPKAQTANAGAHKDDSDSTDQTVNKVQDEKHDTSSSAAHKGYSNSKDQTVSDAHDDESDTPNAAVHKDYNDPEDQAVNNAQDDESDTPNSAAHKDDTNPKDQTATKAQNEESDPSNSAARVLAGILHGIAHDDPAKSDAPRISDDIHSGAELSNESSETANTPTTDEAEDSSGQPNVKSPANPVQSVDKTDGDGEPSAQSVPGIDASHESSPDRMSGSSALGEPAHAVAGGSAHPPSTEIETVPEGTSFNGLVVSASAGHAASANDDPRGDSEVNEVEGTDDSDMPSSSSPFTATGNRGQADRVAGPLADGSDSSPNAAAAAESESDPDSTELESTASSAKDGDVAPAAMTQVGPAGTATDVDGSASTPDPLGETATSGTGTESPSPSSPATRSDPSLSSANAQASSVPSSKDENSGTRPPVLVGGLGYVLLALYAMVL
jgi:hypothetical protein